MGDLTKNFSSEEMQCRCVCSISNVSRSFINRLQKARDIAGIPFPISSGCRCPSWNKNEGGSEKSDHITTDEIQCTGADIKCTNSKNRYIMIKAGLEAGFTRIGIGAWFIHFGMSNTNAQEVIWLY